MSWIAARLRDLFYGVGNKHLDLGRVLAFVVTIALVCGQLWNMILGVPLDLGPGGLGGGLAAVITAAAALIAAKDIAHRKSSSE